MPPKKKIRIKKKNVVLTPRSIEHVMEEPQKNNASQTLHIEDADTEDLENSASQAVELNSATVKDPVKQTPLEAEKAKPSPKIDLTLDLSEPTFKFFCYRCGQKLKVPRSWANLSTTCGRCKHDVVVPPPLSHPDGGV